MTSLFSSLGDAQAVFSPIREETLVRLPSEEKMAAQMAGVLLEPVGSIAEKRDIEKVRELITKKIIDNKKLWRKIFDRWPCSRDT